ncbi:DUF3429 domain-containing protein [Caenispirillum bisanense]|uniref:DUF3429 domain-containing protein n=1 Tax=Caenispirillum bisanense TaxID=414052 RepID=UPI0031DCAE42
MSATSPAALPGADPQQTHRRLARTAAVLGFAGLIPFYVGAAGVWMARHPFDVMAHKAQITYGAVILAFLGAVHWGLVLRMPYGVPRLMLVWGVVPPLVGWAALAFSAPLSHAIMMLGFLAAFAADHRAALSGLTPPWYGRLRLVLTTLVLLALALSGLRFMAYPLFDAFHLVPAASEAIAI